MDERDTTTAQQDKRFQQEAVPTEFELKETGRIEAFSDGIFAVAITLLVLNIKPPASVLPDYGMPGLWDALLGNWQSYLAFLTSFLTIGIMWMNYHRLFTLIRYSDDILLVLNLLLLLFIVFVPYPTMVLAEYIQRGSLLAAQFYSGTYVLMAICFNGLWRYASHKKRLVGKQVSDAEVRAITWQYSFGPISYLLAFGLAFWSAPVSLGFNLLLALFYLIPPRALRRAKT